MIKKLLRKFSINNSRFIYQSEEQLPSASTDPVILNAANEALREVEGDKDKEKEGSKEESEKATQLPEIPREFKGLTPSPEVKKNENGSFEQKFEFGDSKTAGKIIMPQNPKPGEKTTIVFNYVDDPEKLDSSKFWEDLQKNGKNTGNTVVVTLRTPEDIVEINGQKASAMKTLLADLEKLQNDNNIKGLARAETLIHIAEKDQLPKAQKLLAEYNRVSKTSDSRASGIQEILEKNNPDTLVSDIEKEVERIKNRPKNSKDNTEVSGSSSSTESDGTSSSSSSVFSGGGANADRNTSSGTSGGSYSETRPESNGAETQDSSGSDISSNATESDSVAPTGNKEALKDSNEKIGNKSLVISDSLGVGISTAQNFPNLESQPNFSHVKESKMVTRNKPGNDSMISIIKSLDKSGELSEYSGGRLVLLGGTNDVFAPGVSAKEIIDTLKEIYTIADRNGLKVYPCTIPPFKGCTGDYDEANKKREIINREIKLLSGKYNIIDLAAPFPDGMADPNDKNNLHNDYSGTDKLHFNPEGYKYASSLINKKIGEKEGTNASSKTRQTNMDSPSSHDNTGDKEPTKRERNDQFSYDDTYVWSGDKAYSSTKLGQSPTENPAIPSSSRITPAMIKQFSGKQKAYFSQAVKKSQEFRRQVVRDVSKENKNGNKEDVEKSKIGLTKVLPGNFAMSVEWHPNHTGKWGTAAYRVVPGWHLGVSVYLNNSDVKRNLRKNN